MIQVLQTGNYSEKPLHVLKMNWEVNGLTGSTLPSLRLSTIHSGPHHRMWTSCTPQLLARIKFACSHFFCNVRSVMTQAAQQSPLPLSSPSSLLQCIALPYLKIQKYLWMQPVGFQLPHLSFCRCLYLCIGQVAADDVSHPLPGVVHLEQRLREDAMICLSSCNRWQVGHFRGERY